MNNDLSIRNRILLAIQAAFTNIDKDDATLATPFNPSADPIGISFTTVAIGGLQLTDTRKINSLGIVAGAETKRGKYPLWECSFNISLEFRSAHNQGDIVPGLIAERTLTAIERVVYNNRTWGGLAIDTLDVGNEIDIANYQDAAVYGVFKMIVNYRHSDGDPRIIVP